MPHAISYTAPGFGSQIIRWTKAFLKAIDQLPAYTLASHRATDLSQMTDAELQEIGLTRDEIVAYAFAIRSMH